MNFDFPLPFGGARRVGAIALFVLTAAGTASAQIATPTPAAPFGFPGAASLPTAPSDTRLPGPDPRQCGSTRWSALCAEGRWSKFARMQVEMKAPGFVGTYMMDHPENNDVHTTYIETAGTRRRSGEIVFVNEDAFAYRSRDRFESPASMLDEMMTSPILVTQLAALLLDQGALVGPDDITKRLDFTAHNATQFLRTEAPGAAALFGPPWEMTGSVRPGDDGTLAFRMRLSHRPVDSRGRVRAGKRDIVEINGTVSYRDRRKAMSPTFDLVGWNLVHLGNKMDEVKTLDEARQAVGGR